VYEFSKIWINKTEERGSINYSLFFRVPYESYFKHLPIIHTEIWQNSENYHKNLDKCADNEKEFHTNFPLLSENQLIDLLNIIYKALNEKPGLIKL
jgi:hypothetical protein